MSPMMYIHKITTWRGDERTRAGAILCGASPRANRRQRTVNPGKVTCPECLGLMPVPVPKAPRVRMTIHNIPRWGEDSTDLTTLCGEVGDRRRPNKRVTCKECRALMRQVTMARANTPRRIRQRGVY
jgi:hypothetical protein